MKFDELKSAKELEPQEAQELLKKKGRELGVGTSEEPFRSKSIIDLSASEKESDVRKTDLRELLDKRSIPWVEEYKDRDIYYFASDERPDSDGDIVKQNWNFKEFKDNPAMPYGHRWSEPPIGRHIDWGLTQRKEKSYEGPALWLRSLFATEEQSIWADSVFRLVKSKLLLAGSVGFYSDKIIWIEDEEERNALGLGRWGVIWDKNHLLEFSPVTIPANPGAVQMQLCSLRNNKSSGDILHPEDIAFLREQAREGLKDNPDSWKTYDSLFVQAGKVFFPEHKDLFCKHTDIDEPVDYLSFLYKTSEEDKTSSEEESNLEKKLDTVLENLATLDGKVEKLSKSVKSESVEADSEEFNSLFEGLSEFIGAE